MKKTTETTTDEQLEALFRELGLGFFAENFIAAIATAARNGVPHAELLAGLARGELEARFGRRVQRRLQQARLPFLRTMDDFDWTHPRSINRAQVEQLMRLEFLKDKGNVLILGPVGVGKTHIASCLARKACEKGVSTLFVQAVDIVNDLSAAFAANRLLQGMRKYTSPRSSALTSWATCRSTTAAPSCSSSVLEALREKLDHRHHQHRAEEVGSHLQRQRHDRLGHPRQAAAPQHRSRYRRRKLPGQGKGTVAVGKTRR